MYRKMHFTLFFTLFINYITAYELNPLIQWKGLVALSVSYVKNSLKLENNK